MVYREGWIVCALTRSAIWNAVGVLLVIQLSQSFHLPAKDVQFARRSRAQPPVQLLNRCADELLHRRSTRLEGARSLAQLPAESSVSSMSKSNSLIIATESLTPRTSTTVRRQAERADELFAAAVSTFEEVASAEESLLRRDDALVHGLHLLEEVFRLDFEVVNAVHYLNGGLRSLRNVTCMRPAGANLLVEPHQLRDDALLALKLEPGRVCRDGSCCDACSRVLLPQLATDAECILLMQRAAAYLPDDAGKEPRNLPLEATAAIGDLKLHLLYIRLIERMRRSIAHEYGLDLRRVSPRQTFINRLCSSMNASGYDCLNAEQ